MEKYLYEDLYNLEEKHWWHISKRKSVLSFLSNFLKKPQPKILDIGCGAGKNVETLQSYGETWGLDSSEDAIEFCKKRGIKNIKLGRSSKTGFESNSFDVVTLLDVLEHVEENPTLKEINRILKENGLFLITVPAFEWLWSKWDEVLHHKRRYTKKSIIKALKENNFEVLKISYMFSFLIVPALITRGVKSIIFKNYYPSDFRLSNPFVNKLLTKISDLERPFVLAELIPLGTSLICIAKK